MPLSRSLSETKYKPTWTETKRNLKMQIETEDSIITFEDTPEIHTKVFDELINNYFKKYDAFIGEVILQSDEPIIEAPHVLATIADKIIKFNVKNKEY